jgi:Fic family protein
MDEIVRAEVAISRLNAFPHLPGIEAMSRFLLRAESISSSQIEGLVVSQRRLAQALYDPALATDVARSVVGNITAMLRAIEIGAQAARLTLEDLLSIHQVLLENTAYREIAGKLREEQNWIGGRLNAPLNAEYIPPPPEYVPDLLHDLLEFCEREDIPPVLQAAIAHAQFETIHPFVDGNGRVGRALIHIILRRRGAVTVFVPPVSNVLAAHADRYIAGLTAYREDDVAGWSLLFAQAMQTAAVRADALAQTIARLQSEWLDRIAGTRSHATVRKLIDLLPGTPVLDARRAAELTGISTVSTRKALDRLQEVGAVRLLKTDARRGKIWVADEFLGILNAFEWHLAAPTREGARRRSPRPTRTSLERYLQMLGARAGQTKPAASGAHSDTVRKEDPIS